MRVKKALAGICAFLFVFTHLYAQDSDGVAGTSFYNGVFSEARAFSSHIGFSEVAAPRENRYALYVGALSGFLYGQIDEIVYQRVDRKDSNYKLSELIWDVKPVFYAGAGFYLTPRNPLERISFVAEARVKIAFPGNSGNMIDRDWQDPSNRLINTDFSKHDNIMTKSVLADAQVGLIIPFMIFYIKPLVTFDFMYFSFIGQNGFGKYMENYTPLVRDYKFSGNVITYTQSWFSLAPGIALGAQLGKRFDMEAAFQITPLIYCQAVDEHLVRDILFIDNVFLGIMVNTGVKLNWAANDYLSLSVAASYREVSDARGRGQSKSGDDPVIYFAGNIAGAGYRLFNVELSVKVRLLEL
jgi:outer membrane protease